MLTLTARYDAEIVEAKRDLELALCDLSCTKANAKRIKLETAKRLHKLNKSKRRALMIEKADNKRYFACLRASKIKPKNRRVDRAELAKMYQRLTVLLEERDRANEMLQSIYLFDSYKKSGQVDTPWYKAFIREKKRWHKKLRGDLRVIDSMNLSRRDKQKLRADLDCIATAHADIVETKCRIHKQKLKGAAKLILIEPIAAKREIAKTLGADITIDPITEDVSTVLQENGITRISTVIECVGKTATMKQAVAIAGKKSTVMLFGLTRPGDEMEIKPFELFKKEITLKASFINPYTQKRALALINSEKIDVASMIYKCIPVTELPSTLADKKLRSAGKYIVTFD
jgi:hypothetical protein